MDLNRNQFFFLGLVVLLVGLQFRVVSTYVLNPQATKFLADRTGHSQSTTSATFFAFTGGTSAAPRKVLQPPEWLGWCVMSVGAVLVLHSFALARPS